MAQKDRDGNEEKEEEASLKDVGTQTLSRSSLPESSRFSSYDSKLQISYDRRETEMLSFPQWHQRMQKEHEAKFGSLEGAPKFSLWEWCNTACAPCRYVDSVDFNKKLCGVCFKFRTFKTWTTGTFIAAFFYLTLYVIIGEDILPGGTYFVLLVMFIVAFLVGSIFLNVGLPPPVGQLLVGIAFGNLPLERYEEDILPVVEYSERIVLVIILIRAALQLDFAQIYGNVRIIAEYALIPYIFELILILVCGRYLMELPWEWSALQGVIIAPVSLATVVSILEKNRKFIIVERSKIPTILIAASSIEIIISLYCFSIIFAAIFSKGLLWVSSWWVLLIAIILQLIGGVLIGVCLGCIAGMFPDRRSIWAPYCRIVFIGSGTIGLIMCFNELGMTGVGVLSSITMVFIASNIWEELGWHESSTPVIYFYSLLYYFAQPICVSLVGYTIIFKNMEVVTVGITLATIAVGITARVLACILISVDRSLPTNMSEKIFICISWTPKGAVEALLGAILSGMIKEHYYFVTDPSFTIEELLEFAKKILLTITLAILVTSPLATLLTTFLTPRLFKQ